MSDSENKQPIQDEATTKANETSSTEAISAEESPKDTQETSAPPAMSMQVLAEMEAFQERVAAFGKALQSQMSKQRVLLEAMEREKQRYLKWRSEHPEHHYDLSGLLAYLQTVYMPKAHVEGTAGMGRGIFAKEDLEAGDVVIAEEPLVSAVHTEDAEQSEVLGVFVQSWQVVCALASSDLSVLPVFLEQVDAHGDQKEDILARLQKIQSSFPQMFPSQALEDLVLWLGIVQSNAFMLHLKKQKAVGVFPAVAMLNHSCQPNASSYNEGTTMIVQASVPIAKGEEIMHSYLSRPNIPVERRQELLKERFGFLCRCPACVRDLGLS